MGIFLEQEINIFESNEMKTYFVYIEQVKQINTHFIFTCIYDFCISGKCIISC